MKMARKVKLTLGLDRKAIIKSMKVPKYSQFQLIVLVITLVFFAAMQGWINELQSLIMFTAFATFTLAILFMNNPLGKREEIVRNFIKILANGQSNDEKVIQTQNMVVALCQQLGLYYEREKEKALKECAIQHEK